MDIQYSHNRVAAILSVCLMALFCLGCSLPRHVAENISGNYMEGLDSDEAAKISQICLYGIDECFEKVLAVLNSEAIDATILKINRRHYSILALVSAGGTVEEIDSIFDANSADVGIYLAKIGPETTKVEIRSLSTVFRDFSAQKIFPELQTKN